VKGKSDQLNKIKIHDAWNNGNPTNNWKEISNYRIKDDNDKVRDGEWIVDGQDIDGVQAFWRIDGGGDADISRDSDIVADRGDFKDKRTLAKVVYGCVFEISGGGQ
jgi:hypothetical protein